MAAKGRRMAERGGPLIAGVILAGGQARRMGGVDKASCVLSGRRLLDHALARLGAQCEALAVNANGDPARFDLPDLPVIADSVPGFAGPLAGVLAGLDWAADQGAAAIVTVAVDTPFFPTDLVARLQQVAGPAGLALAASPDESGRLRRHPTFGLWPVGLRADLRAALNDGLRKIVAWTDRHQAGLAEWPSVPFDPFFNVNTPEDIRAAEELLRQRA